MSSSIYESIEYAALLRLQFTSSSLYFIPVIETAALKFLFLPYTDLLQSLVLLSKFL